MSQPIILDLPHHLGKSAVKARLEEGMEKVAQMVPGAGQITHRWEGDTMLFSLTALGQAIRCRIVVFEDKVHAEIDLPAMFALFGTKIREVFKRELPKLLK